MRKADMDDIWEIRFLLYSLPLIKETVAYLSKIKKNIPTPLFKIEDVKERVTFYKLF